MIEDSDVQYYMIFEPYTNFVDYEITKMIWTLPAQFGIPAIRDLDQCIIQDETIPFCKLYRNISKFIIM
jgi:hypothetical protein